MAMVVIAMGVMGMGGGFRVLQLSVFAGGVAAPSWGFGLVAQRSVSGD